MEYIITIKLQDCQNYDNMLRKIDTAARKYKFDDFKETDHGIMYLFEEKNEAEKFKKQISKLEKIADIELKGSEYARYIIDGSD